MEKNCNCLTNGFVGCNDTERGYVSNVNRIELIGQVAKTTTPLRPAGTIRMDNDELMLFLKEVTLIKENMLTLLKLKVLEL